MDSINIKRTKSSNYDFANLITLLDKDLSSRYHSEQKKYDKYNKIESIDTVILVYHHEIAIGCGCFKRFDSTTVEIKRMFIKPNYRGKGISKLILNELECWATDLGFSRAVLETGKRQQEAIGLYEKSGFERIDNYGQYIDLPNSVCFEKIF